MAEISPAKNYSLLLVVSIKDIPVKMNPYYEEKSIPNFWLSCLLIDEDAMCKQAGDDQKALYISSEGKSCPTETLETLASFNAESRPIWKPMHMQPKTFYVFDLNVPQIFNEKPKKGEEQLDENGEVVEVDTRTGFYSDDIANTFGVPMAQYKNRQMKLGFLAQPSNGAEGFYPNRQTDYRPFSPSVKESGPF